MDTVYKITIWRRNASGHKRRIVKYGDKRRVIAQLRASRSTDAHGLVSPGSYEDTVAIQMMTGDFNEVSALFDCGPDNGEGTWLADTGPNPVRSKNG